jgi:hypothetical protein
MSTQLAPFWQGVESQSSMFSSQLKPVQPDAQMQVYALTWSSQ